jgi:hypothetical protein
MTIFLRPAQLVVSIKQHLMHIGKSTRMVGTDKSSFEYEVFYEPINPGTCQPTVVDDQK